MTKFVIDQLKAFAGGQTNHQNTNETPPFLGY